MDASVICTVNSLVIPALLLFGGLSGAGVMLHSGYQKDQDNIQARQEYRDLVVDKVVDPLAENIAARGGILAGDNREYLIDSLTPIAVRGASLDERQDQWKEATITELPQFHITVLGFVDSCAVSSRSWDGEIQLTSSCFTPSGSDHYTDAALAEAVDHQGYTGGVDVPNQNTVTYLELGSDSEQCELAVYRPRPGADLHVTNSSCAGLFPELPNGPLGSQEF